MASCSEIDLLWETAPSVFNRMSEREFRIGQRTAYLLLRVVVSAVIHDAYYIQCRLF